MEKDNSLEKKMAIIFATHPNETSFHFTSDGAAFYKPADAVRHAQTLPDKSVKEIHRDRPEVEAGQTDIPNAGIDLTDRKTLAAKYLELFGKKPNNFMGVDKMKAEIASKEAGQI